ncbi:MULTISPECIES: immunity 49 family protein [Nocardiopsis]|uniref:Immunity 49 family protein n=1 Tax=Nocardiopsis dassonvillei (strain ATCC 23218 / DSM 43111 / CIP 107115 / JCM 7437 / KCTC 9190 / NBRC 14626 / NCTC 10488 / NRRL B-5397 / IMRU 509) TaxID=446468 RepID=D7AZ29_NOCDD|nr:MULTISPECIES: immunity 49 family protein [Nocardiopsis]ADH70009.1 conserved hypothetical protein [Nocardiopsis dassonvillei subsp. dassonvillei DSM 43111]APC37995.1 hypothetical protein A9R04_26450 [Nocardiopsis dassonvillei]VEI90523.1 Uncharacterised protein [Nocardiopsis dassonvillei]
MTYRIESHRIDNPAYRIKEKQFQEKRVKKIDDLSRHPESIGTTSSTVYRYAKIALTLDPEGGKLETWEAWAAAMQVFNAVFDLSTAPEGARVQCVIDHEVRDLTATGPGHFTNAGNWETAFFLAVTCRDEKRWRRLCEVPVDLLREAGERGGIQHNEYVYHWVAALQAFVLNRPGLADHLARAMELSDPRNGAFGGDTLDRIVFPQMNAFRFFAANDADGFNRALAEGLTAFRDHYTATAESAEDVHGVVPLGLLALACWAHDRGHHHPEFTLEVESGYLPKYLLDGGWVGEFPT